MYLLILAELVDITVLLLKIGIKIINNLQHEAEVILGISSVIVFIVYTITEELHYQLSSFTSVVNKIGLEQAFRNWATSIHAV